MVTDVTALGDGFRFVDPSVNALAEVAFQGMRSALYAANCPGGVCNPAVPLIANGAPGPGAFGLHVDSMVAETFNGVGRLQAFTGVMAGAARRDVVIALSNGVPSAVAASGQALPGGVGTFSHFPTSDALFGVTQAPAVGRRVIAFHAEIIHPTATEGLFVMTNAGLSTIALEGDPAPSGDFFSRFGAPVVRKKSIVFHAETGTDSCIYAVKRPGLPIVTLACEGDVVVGTTIDVFAAQATGSYTEAWAVTELSSGPDACLLRLRGGVATSAGCVDDPFINGEFLASLVGDAINNGPVAEANNKGLVAIVQGDFDFNDTLVATRRGVLYPLFRNFETPAPVSGGAISYGGAAPATMFKKTVVFAADISSGTAHSAAFAALVK
jgi:hypothetical protein